MEEHGNPRELPHGPLFGVSDFDAYHRMMREAGFRDSSVRELALVWSISSIESLLDAFGDWAQVDALPDSVRTAIDASVRKNARAYESGGTLRVPNPAILVSATK